VTPELQGKLVTAAITIAAVALVIGQCRRPRWWLGRFIARTMNVQHSGVTDWGLEHVPLEKHFTILDVGCGGGRTIHKLATVASDGMVHGIDYSAASVATARRTNTKWIETGRVEIRQGSVSHLPFADGTFDVVTAVETHYYWPDLVADMREIRRVLKSGGRFVLIAETYKGRRFDALYRPTMKLLRARYLTLSEHRDVLAAAGYAGIEVFEERSKGWMCAVGCAPGRDAGRASSAG
jgi:SAM-dependent methyltransferase